MNKQNYGDYFYSYIESIKSDIEKLKSSYPSDFDKVVNLIISSKGRLVFSGIGKSGQAAKKISSSIASTGTPSFFVHPSEAVHGDLGMIQKDDIVFAISNSGNTKELFGIIDYCKNQNIKLVSITSNPDSDLAKNSNYNLFIPKVDEFSHLGSPCNSIILTLIIGDALMIALHNEKRFSKDEYKLFHPSGSLGKSMTRIEDIMIKDFPICFADSDITNVLIDMSSKKFDVCIAVDSNNKLIGILEIESIKEWLKPRTNVKPKEDYIKKNIITDDLINYDFEVINKNTLVFEVMQIYNKGEENKKNIIVLDENDFAVGFINEEIIDKMNNI